MRPGGTFTVFEPTEPINLTPRAAPERVPNEVMLELDRKDREADRRKAEAEKARNLAAEAIALASIQVVQVLMEALHDEDPQVRLRASEILLSRSISKVAARHAALSDDEIVDTVDVKALRDSILEEVKKKR